jgi:hypothetical protein
VTFAVVSLAWPSDVWKTKPYQQWNRKDVTKILNHSPWVKTTSVAANWKAGNVLTSPEVVTGSPTATNNPQVAMNGAAGLGMRPRQAHVKFEARWVSAVTMREAVARLTMIEGKLTTPVDQNDFGRVPADYLISILSPDMTPFAKLETVDITKITYLQMRKSKLKLIPEDVTIERTADGTHVLSVTLSFPKTANGQPTIAANETGMELVCKLKGATLRFRFDPRKMTGNKGRDL